MSKRYQSVSLSLLLAVGCLSLLYAVSARADFDIKADVPTATIEAELATEGDIILKERTNLIEVNWSAENTDRVYIVSWEEKMYDQSILKEPVFRRHHYDPLRTYDCSINFKEPGLYAAGDTFFIPENDQAETSQESEFHVPDRQIKTREEESQEEAPIILDAVPAKSACPTAKLKQILKNRLKGFEDVLYVYEMEGGEGTAHFKASHWKNPFAIIAFKGELYSYAADQIDFPKVDWDELYALNFGQDVFGDEEANIAFTLHNVRGASIDYLPRCNTANSAGGSKSWNDIPNSTSTAISSRCVYEIDHDTGIHKNEQVGWNIFTTTLIGTGDKRTVQYSPTVFRLRTGTPYYPNIHVASITREGGDKTGKNDNYVIGPSDGRYDDCSGKTQIVDYPPIHRKKIPNYYTATGFFWHEGVIKANTAIFPLWISGENIQKVTVDCYEKNNPQSDLSASLQYGGLDGKSVPLTASDKVYIDYYEPKEVEVKVPTEEPDDVQYWLDISCNVELTFTGGEKRKKTVTRSVKVGVFNKTTCCHHYADGNKHDECIDWLKETVPTGSSW